MEMSAHIQFRLDIACSLVNLIFSPVKKYYS